MRADSWRRKFPLASRVAAKINQLLRLPALLPISCLFQPLSWRRLKTYWDTHLRALTMFHPESQARSDGSTSQFDGSRSFLIRLARSGRLEKDRGHSRATFESCGRYRLLSRRHLT